MPKFALIKFCVFFLFGLGATLLIGLAYPVFLLTTLVLGVFGFKMGKSTRVPVNPRDVPFSPMAVLSYREFDRWARQHDLRRTDPEFFSRTDVHWTEKLPVLFSGSDAAGHCFEPGRSSTKILFADVALGHLSFSPRFVDRSRACPTTGRSSFSSCVALHWANWLAERQVIFTDGYEARHKGDAEQGHWSEQPPRLDVRGSRASAVRSGGRESQPSPRRGGCRSVLSLGRSTRHATNRANH